MSVHKITKQNKFHFFKVLIHELNEVILINALNSKNMIAKIDIDLNFLFRIVFSDEATF